MGFWSWHLALCGFFFLKKVWGHVQASVNLNKSSPLHSNPPFSAWSYLLSQQNISAELCRRRTRTAPCIEQQGHLMGSATTEWNLIPNECLNNLCEEDLSHKANILHMMWLGKHIMRGDIYYWLWVRCKDQRFDINVTIFQAPCYSGVKYSEWRIHQNGLFFCLQM